jgi:hypothetical protein
VSTKSILKSQYRASVQMLRKTVVNCSESLWNDDKYQNRFWQIAFHAVFYTHFYLHATEDDFVPWGKHKDSLVSLGEYSGEEAYTKAEILEYLDTLDEKLDDLVDALQLEAESGFNWLPFSKLELQLYNIRHMQLHTGELCERLGRAGEIEIPWVGMAAPQE